LQVGGCSLLGLGASDLVRTSASANATGGGFGQAKACIILYLYGAPSQLETYDPKPEAPVEIRGEFNSIETTTPGLRISEHLPRLATVLDRATVIRSMTHRFNIHSAAYTLSGVPFVDVPMELNAYDTRHWPYIGSVLDFLESRGKKGEAVAEVPRSVALPFKFSKNCGEFKRAGPYGGFLGGTYDPVWTEFTGAEATKTIGRWRGGKDEPVRDPFCGIQDGGYFQMSAGAELPPELTLDRFETRRSLLEQFDAARRDLGNRPAVAARERFREMAFSLIGSEHVRDALDIRREPKARREAYGMNLFGQAVLAARRMVEAGAKLVTVFWDEYGTANSAWDTHFDHYDRLKQELLPGLDAAFTSLVTDLEERGMLDETLVACISEHGRTPRMDDVRGGGRGHWSRAYGGLFAGGGTARGKVIGRTDRDAADVVERPVSPKDILATIYHQLGVDPEQMIKDRLGRPLPLVPDGHVVREMLS
jgi:hypothetical protein